VTHWNGIPIDRAVALNGERNGGSNVDARHARGLASMTQRPMALLAPPEDERVDLSFTADGAAHQVRFQWQVLGPPPAPTAAAPSQRAATSRPASCCCLLFTPRRIEPEHLHFITTPLTLEATATPGSGLEPWHESIGEAFKTGTPFSDGRPLAPRYVDACNSIGQR
jgi:hypothetical protein